MDVFLTVKDVVPDTQQPDLTQQACLFINKKLGTEYSTEGLGDFSKTEEKTIVSITGFRYLPQPTPNQGDYKKRKCGVVSLSDNRHLAWPENK